MPVLLVLLFALAGFSGCARKKPVLVMPTEQPPATAPTPAPEAQSQPQQTPEPAAQPSDQDSGNVPAETPAEKAKKKPRHGGLRKPSPAERSGTQTAQNNKKVINEDAGGTPEKPSPSTTPAPISPAISPGDAARAQTITDQLLQSTENNLSGIKRQLSNDEQAIVAQIRNFVTQSRQAIKDNDPMRARNLALKANLLSNELVKK